MKKIILPIVGLIFLCKNVTAQENEMNNEHHEHMTHHSHFSTAPIGVVGDHMHHKNSLMLSYRFMNMNMNGNLSATNNINNSDIFSSFIVSPQSMNMNMHMIGAMYALSNKFTLMLMDNYISNSMDLTSKMGVDFKTQSNGFSDLKVSGLIKLIDKGSNSIHSIISISIPTGSINKKDNTPTMQNAQLAYPMQTGSGTWDPLLGITYLGQSKIVLWGIQAKYKFRIGKNSENYTLGNEFLTTVWGAIKVSKKLQFSIRTSFLNSEKISGSDAKLNPMMMPLFNPKNSGGRRLDLLSGINYYFTEGTFKGTKIGLEVGYPMYQNVNGIQMKQDISAIVGIQYVFGSKNMNM